MPNILAPNLPLIAELAATVQNLIPNYYRPKMLKLRDGKSLVRGYGLASPGGETPILEDLGLAKTKGDAVTFQLRKPLGGAPVTSGTRLTGSEQKPVYSYVKATLEEYVAAEGIDGPLTRQKINFNMERQVIPALAQWEADLMSLHAINALKLSGTYDTSDATYPQNAVIFGGDKTSFGNLTATDRLNCSILRDLSTLADERGISPCMMPGYGEVRGVLLVTPRQKLSLRSDPEWIESAQTAWPRSEKNPMFRKPMGIYEDIVVICPTHAPGSYGQTKSSHLYQESVDEGAYYRSEAIFMGASALGFAEVYSGKMVPGEITDYEREWTMSCQGIWAFAKIQINMGTAASALPFDYGTIYVATGDPSVGFAG